MFSYAFPLWYIVFQIPKAAAGCSRNNFNGKRGSRLMGMELSSFVVDDCFLFSFLGDAKVVPGGFHVRRADGPKHHGPDRRLPRRASPRSVRDTPLQKEQ